MCFLVVVFVPTVSVDAMLGLETGLFARECFLCSKGSTYEYIKSRSQTRNPTTDRKYTQSKGTQTSSHTATPGSAPAARSPAPDSPARYGLDHLLVTLPLGSVSCALREFRPEL
jgi:hypothetical protein